jgi:phosphatidate cytidylyltransferase
VRQRALSAAVLVPAVAIAFVAGNPWLSLGLAALAMLAGAECATLLRRAGLPADPGIPILAAPVAVAGTLLAHPVTAAPGYAALVVMLSAVAAFRKSEVRAASLTWVGGSFAALYVSLLAFVPLAMLEAPPVAAGSSLAGTFDNGRIWLLLLVLTVWSSDTFAYLVGRAYPRGHFMPRISPNKTWSGAIGGTIGAMLVCAGVGGSVAGLHLSDGLLLGLTLSVAAQAGDVSESLLKRAAGAKDAGTAIPGHGGILDRVDSFLFAAPVLYLVLVLVPNLAAGGPL